LSLDEFAQRKGYKSFLTTLVDLEDHQLLEVINGHKQAEIILALQDLPEAVRIGVEEVSIDMWGGFKRVIETVFPQAQIVYDRFHVMKHINHELNRLRKLVQVSEKGLPHLLWKNAEDITAEQQVDLETALEKSPCLAIAYTLKEELRRIYQSARTVSSGRRKLTKWLRLARLLYRESASMIEKHLDGICHYFQNHTTSGFTEGVNTKIKLIKRQAYGLPAFKHLRLRLLACFNA
jgi:transposase